MTKAFTRGAIAVLLVSVAGSAGAHPGHDAGSGFAAGFAHPLGGADHVVAMVAVGLTGRRSWPPRTVRARIGAAMAVATGIGKAFLETWPSG